MKKVLCASILCLASLTANAAVLNAGVINPQQQIGTNNFAITESPFNDVYQFTLLDDAIFTSNVTGLGMTLFDTDLFFGSSNLNLTDTVTTPATAINIASGPVTLSAGDYSFMITGLLSGESGAYVGSFTLGNPAQASAVPEPEAYAMFLAGLGLLGFVSRKRKSAV